MSLFGGKYNFYDSIYGKDFEKLKNINLLIGAPYGIGPDQKIKIDNPKDFIYWYDHGIAMSFANKEQETVILSRYPMSFTQRMKYGVSCLTYEYNRNINEELRKNGLPLKYTEEECMEEFWSKTSFVPYLFKPNLPHKYRFDNLFLRYDSNKEIYLVYEYKYQNEQFIIVKINDDVITKIRNKEITIEEIFRNSNEIYFTHYDIDRNWLYGKKRKGQTCGKKYFRKIPKYYDLEKIEQELKSIKQ